MKNNKNYYVKYLVANKSDELWGVYVTNIGYGNIPSNTNYPPKGHPSTYWFNPNTGRVLHEYQIIYITNGEGVFESANCKLSKVSAGTIILLFPDEWHTYKPSKQTGWDEYWIGFNGDNITKLAKNKFFFKNNPLIRIGFNEQIVSLFKQGVETANFQKTAYQQILAGIATLLLGIVFYADKNNFFRDKEIISKIEKARVMMRENTGENSKPENIAKSLNLGYSWFRRVFKQYTGFSPTQYQMEIKLQKSKELLTSTALAIKEIAFDMNFESVSYFITFFKTKTGLSPTEYRNKVHGKDIN
jgi:AraC-like DNA-binding protein